MMSEQIGGQIAVASLAAASAAAIGAGHSVKKLDEIAPPSLPLRGLGHLSAQTSTLEGVEDGFWHSSVSEWSMSASVKSRHSHRKMSRPL
jgi:hypothetical protein